LVDPRQRAEFAHCCVKAFQPGNWPLIFHQLAEPLLIVLGGSLASAPK
jgi:hypothetical protein